MKGQKEKLSVSRKFAVSVLFDTVTLEVICGDDYEAQVLYDDLIERLQSGQSITLTVDRPPGDAVSRTPAKVT